MRGEACLWCDRSRRAGLGDVCWSCMLRAQIANGYIKLNARHAKETP